MTRQLFTDAEHTQWSEHGYLHIEHALDDREVRSLKAALSALHTRFLEHPGTVGSSDVFDAGNDRDISIVNGLTWCPELDGLIDHPSVFGKILGLLGPYLQLLGSEIFYRYPAEEPLVAFHTDQGPSLRHATPNAREIQLKAQFFLTDVTTPNSGNFTVAPGSHRTGFPGKIDYHNVADPHQILAAAGDVVLFPLTLGHSVAPNTTDTTRVSVVLRYGQLFCRPVDYWTTPEESVLARQTPRRRRLLGDLGARTRPGDVYGVIPDQLEVIYADDWRDTIQAETEFEAAQRAQHAYEIF